jgi:hypothetical protein
VDLKDAITEKTFVPISLVISITGGIIWLSAMWFKTEASAAEIEKVKTDLAVLKFDVVDRLARIETKIDEIKEVENGEEQWKKNK